MIRKVIPLMALFATGFATAQVGIGTVTPANSSQLDIVSDNKGVLFPRVNLKGEKDKDPIVGDLTESLFVYNLGLEGMPPGFYYWDKEKWVRLLNNQSFINTTNESFSLINDRLTITDSEGNTVSMPLDDIVSNSNFITEIINKLKGKYGNVYYNTTDHKFYYIEESDGTHHLITWEDLNTTNVTFTLEDDYLTVTDLDNSFVRLHVEEIANNLTFVDKLIENQRFISEIINKLKGKYGNVVYNATENKFYYIKEDGTQGEIDWSSINTTNVSFTLDADMLTVTDSDGNKVQLDVKEIANNSTFITELTQNEEFVTAITNNETFITEVINKLKGKYGNVVYNATENKFYYIKEDGTQGEIDWSSINTTNVSFTLDADMLTVTDSDGNKVQLDVKEIANNSTFITELTQNEEFVTAITNNETFITEVINKLKGKYGNVVYNATENKFYYIQEDGTQGEIDWSSINTTNVSFTLDADMLTVTDSDGNKVQLDVKEIANNSTFITELTQNEEFVTAITNNDTFITEVINKLKGKYGNVVYNATENKFYYIKEDGTQGEIDWSSINTTNVSFTLDADMLTVTDSDGNKVQLDVKEIANNSTFITELTQNEEFVTAITNNDTFITEVINKLKGKYGNVVYNATENKFYYIKEDGTQGEIDWSSINTTNVSFTLDADMLTVTDSDGNKVQLDVKEIANNSTFITELTQNEEFVTAITNNETFITEVINKLKGKYGNVVYNATENKFYYIKEDGTQGEIDWSSINTTNVSFTLDADMLTVTDSDGNKVQLDVKEIANNSTFITELTNNDEFITNLTENETLISKIVNKLSGKYGNVIYNATENKFYYIKDDGTQGEVDWSALNTTNVSFTLDADMLTVTDSDGNKVQLDVKEIANNSTFITELTNNDEFITNLTENETLISKIVNKLSGKYGNVIYNATENKFYYIKDDGTQGEVDWSTLNTTNVSFTLDADMLTVTDSDGNKVQLDVKEIANNSTFITELTNNDEFITNLTENETLISKIVNKLSGKYGNVIYNATENKFYYIKDDGTQGEVDWSTLNTTNVSFTLDADMLTVTDSDGNKVQLDVKEIANNSTFITELTNNDEFITNLTENETLISKIVNKLSGKYGNVIYNATENKFYYIKDDGTQGEVDWSTLNTTNVSFTLDADMLTVTDSDGNKVQLDVKEIANNSTFITELTNNDEFITNLTENETLISKIVNKLSGKYGNVIYNATENKFYYIKDDGTQGEVDWSTLNTTNVSFTLDADMLTVTDSDGNKVQLDVKEIANNSTFITELTNNDEFITNLTENETLISKIVNKLSGKYGNVIYNATENKFYYIKDDGTQGEVDWSTLNTTNVSFTLDADMLTVTDSDGNKVQLDVKEIANNATFITELVANETLITEIVNKLSGKYGNVIYNATENKFYYIKDDGTQGEVDWSALNTTNVSFTLDADMLTVTDSDGNKVQLDVKEIANNATFITELVANETLITEIVNKLSGKYGNVIYNATENKFYYIKDDGTQGEVDWSTLNTTNVSFTLDADMLTVTDSDGNKVQLDVKEIANNSTFITELTNNDEFITNLTENETLISKIVNKLSGKYGNVIYNATENKFYYIKDDGTQGEVDWSALNTTNVSFTLDADMLTVTDSDGNKVQLDVKEIANNSTFITELTNNDEFITNLTENETLISKIVNKLSGKYGNVIYNATENKFYYIKDDGTQGEVDWSALNTTNVSFTLDADMLTVTDSDGNKVQLDVKEIANNATFITELVANETLITEIVNKLSGKYGNVIYNAIENKFYYIKDDGTQGEVDWSALNTTNVSFTLDADMLTVTDSDGNKVQLDVKEIANNSTFITELTNNDEFITNLTENETLISKIVNKLSGKYGNVIYNATENKFYYIKDDGTQGEVDWSTLNTTNVSFTLDADMLTVTDSDGNKVQLDVKEIANNATFITELTNNDEFITNLTENETLISKIVNKLSGKYGNVIYNAIENKFYYIKDDGTQGEVDWSTLNTTNVSFTLDADMLTVTDSDGNKVQLDVKEIANNSTFITELTQNEEFVTAITNNETFITEVINKLKGKYGNVVYNATENKFYYIQEDGTQGEIDWSSINTTNVSFTLDADMLTVTDSDGNKVQLDVKEIANNATFITELVANETLITEIVNKLTGKYGNVYYNVTDNKFYYIQEDGTKGEVDWSAINTTNTSFTLDADMLTVTDSDGNKVQLDVKEIAMNDTFITEVINQLKNQYGNVYYDVTNNKYYYIKDDGSKEEVDLGSVTLAGDVTGTAGATTLSKIQGNPVSAAVAAAGQALVFDGTSWVPGTPEVDVTKITAGKELKSDASITVTDGTGTLLKEASIKVADDGITTAHIKDGTILLEDMAKSLLPNQVLVTNGSNIPSWADKSLLSASPWLVQGSSTIATLNTQNIYQTGTIAIGANQIPATETTAKLFVAGDVVTTGKYFTTNAVYADYVFEKYFTGSSDIKLTYEFNTLTDIARFVKENHHLPGVTPISELNKNESGYGFDLTNLSVELLEKVEELFLHTIEQQDQIDQMKKEQATVLERLEKLEQLMEKK